MHNFQVFMIKNQKNVVLKKYLNYFLFCICSKQKLECGLFFTWQKKQHIIGEDKV